MTNTQLPKLLAALADVKKTGDGQWQARCPAHDDHRASLSVSATNGDGKIGVHCHANCVTSDVLAAIGMRMSDLMPQSSNGKPKSDGVRFPHIGTRKIVATYDYCDSNGKLLFQAVRFDPKDFRQRRPKEGGDWEWKVKGTKVVPYRLPELAAADPSKTVFAVEGEKDVDRLRALGLVATCNAGGAGKWKPAHSKYLAGRSVVILSDNDQPGKKHSIEVATSLIGIATATKIVNLPGLPDKGDVSDWLDKGGTAEQLLKLVEACEAWKPEAIEAEVSAGQKQYGDGGEEKERKSQATTIVELAEDVDLFRDGDGEAYARFPVGDGDDLHWEVSRVSTKTFRRWLKRRFYRATGKTPSAQSLQDALGVIEAKAIYDGDSRRVFIRLAEHQNQIYLDLGNDRWQVIEIDSVGWRVVNDPPVMFRRAKAMKELPTPDPYGNIQELRRFANVTNEDWPLLLAWLVASMRPTGPYPVLAVHGEHGSAKSTLCRFARKIIDPNTSPLRADYREPRDLLICANSGWIVALDNLSDIKPWLSDCFCRLSTGGGFSTRTLFENDEETIFDAKRPLILNCIDEVVNRSDLLDRSVLLNLPRIDSEQRISEAKLDREFDEALPKILGGLLAAVSVAIRNQDQVKLLKLPRMADFAIWATAAEPALGLAPGEFLKAYTANREPGRRVCRRAAVVSRPHEEISSRGAALVVARGDCGNRRSAECPWRIRRLRAESDVCVLASVRQ